MKYKRHFEEFSMNKKFQKMLCCFSSSFFIKIWACFLFSVYATYFAGTTKPISRFLFPVTTAVIVFVVAASRK